jgi:hypothetical protein
VSLKLNAIAGDKGWAYDPRTGQAEEMGEYLNTGEQAFIPLADGPDWMLVLDDADQGFTVPGTVA